LIIMLQFGKDVTNLELQGNKFDFEERNADGPRIRSNYGEM